MDQIADTTPPASGRHHIVEDLLHLAKQTRAYVDIALRGADLHPGQDELICALTPKPTMTVSEIADLLHIRPSTVSKTADRLVAKGLLERVPIESDHRKTAVVLTETGVETQKLVREIWRGLEQNLFGELSSSERDEIRKGLKLLDSRLRERVDQFRRPLRQSTSENTVQFRHRSHLPRVEINTETSPAAGADLNAQEHRRIKTGTDQIQRRMRSPRSG